MAKLLANKVYLSFLPTNEVAVSFIVENKYNANLFVQELKELDKIQVEAKAHKEARSIRQNKMLWAVIGKISELINGEKTETSTMKIYADILVEANVKRELMAVLPETLETLKTMFRAVIPTGQSIISKNKETGKEAELITVWAYIGSSRFNTKEMTELIDITLNKASMLGIVDSEIEFLRNEYNL